MRCFKNFSNLAGHCMEALCAPVEIADSSGSMLGIRPVRDWITCPLYGLIDLDQLISGNQILL